jgi:GxxExxY protein
VQQGGGEAGSFWGLSEKVIAACIEVHKALGPGLLESAYERCLAHELELGKIPFQRQVPVRVTYKGIVLDHGYRLDFVVAKVLVVEVKAVESLAPIHEAQLLTYLRLTQLPVGLLVNFHAPKIGHGLRRLTLK